MPGNTTFGKGTQRALIEAGIAAANLHRAQTEPGSGTD